MKCEICGDNVGNISILIKDGNGEKIYCPNCLAIAVREDPSQFINNGDLTCDINNVNGAICYSTFDEKYCLNKDTFIRLVKHELTPNEYKILSTKYSPQNFMLHEDFYDEHGNIV